MRLNVYLQENPCTDMLSGCEPAPDKATQAFVRSLQCWYNPVQAQVYHRLSAYATCLPAANGTPMTSVVTVYCLWRPASLDGVQKLEVRAHL